MKVSHLTPEGVVYRVFFPGISGKYTHYKAHRVSCRYVTPEMKSLTSLINALGERETKTKVIVGIVEPCKVCKPDLIVVEDVEEL